MASVNARRNPSGEIVWRVQARDSNRKLRQQTFLNDKAADKFKALVERLGWDGAIDVLNRRDGTTVPTLQEWTDRYLDPTAGLLTGIEPGTRHGYRRIADSSFLPFLGDLPIDTISKQDVGRWVAWQEKQPSRRAGADAVLSAKTIRNYHALLSNILRAAKEHGVIPENPAHRTRLSKGLAREAVFLSRAEFARLYGATPAHYKPLVAFLVGSQCRWSEATALQWRHINYDTVPPTARIHQAWKKPSADEPTRISVTKTKMGRRTISLWPELISLLGEPGAPDEFVFQGPISGGRQWYSPFRKVWDKAVTRAELNPRPTVHDLRHTGASWLIADGRPLPFIQQRLGHESIQTTISVYGHLLPDAQTEMADSMAGIMSNVLPRLALES